MWSFVRLEKPEAGAADNEPKASARGEDKRDPAAGKALPEDERE